MCSVSVVMSTYNGMRYIDEQLRSIANQIRVPDEIVVRDDCSNDATLEIVEKFAETHDEIDFHILKGKENLGWKASFVEAMKVAKCDYVCLCDQDDIWRRDHISSMVTILEQNIQLMLVVSQAKPFYEENATASVIKGGVEHSDWKVASFTTNYMGLRAPGCTYCYRNTFFDKIENYWTPLLAHDGYLYAFANMFNALVEYNHVTVDFRRHENNASDSRTINRASRLNELNYYIALHEALLKYAYESGEEIEEWKLIEIKRSYSWLVKRRSVIANSQIMGGLYLLLSINRYPSIKNYLSDIWCIVFPNKSLSREILRFRD